MPQSTALLGLALLFLCPQPQQFPPLTINAGPHPSQERTLPTDRPEVVTSPNNQRRINAVRATQEAQELAKLSDGIPSLVEQANSGILSKDLNERLKRIEKLSKQLRREITP